jgi:hypothetical protein
VDKDAVYFLRRQNHGKPLRLTRSHHALNSVQWPFEDVFVQKQDGRQRLVLRRGGNVLPHRQMGEESIDVGFPEVLRVAAIVKENEPPNPVDVRFFCPPTVVANAKRRDNAVV